MPRLRTIGRATIAGLVTGALILGLGGRLLMRVVAVAIHGSGGFSVGGSLEVLAAGALFGTLGGLVLPFVPGRLGRWRAVTHTIALFILVALTSDAARGAASGMAWPARALVLLAFGGLVLGYSLLLIHVTRVPRDATSSAAG
jgi:hypothetical protein